MGCCMRPKYTCSATLVGLVGADWRKSDLNRKKQNHWILPRSTPHQKQFLLFYHHCKGKAPMDIFYVERLFPTCLVWALWLFEWTQLVMLTRKAFFSRKTTSQWCHRCAQPTWKDAVLSPGSDDAFTDSNSSNRSDVMVDHNFVRLNFGARGTSRVLRNSSFVRFSKSFLRKTSL